MDELRNKEKGLCDLLEKTEAELQAIKREVFQLFVSFVAPLEASTNESILEYKHNPRNQERARSDARRE